ncbi:acyl-CoA synthetase [Actinocorallia sp. B10E7]|uniref:acyl-CoA synthetase n=1 Tax=Actinocorallia sp. B10E7 TaxID=3153558 RepID=UPI00325D4798
MDLGLHAAQQPDRPAVIMAESGAVTTYRELNARSTRLARLLRSEGLRPGDHIAIMMENRPEFLEAVWAAQRTGLKYTPVNWHLTAREAQYIVNDSGSLVLITSAALAEVVDPAAPGCALRRTLIVNAGPGRREDYETALAEWSDEPLDDQVEGRYMFYSSGTTGDPKGIDGPLPGVPFGTGSPFDRDLGTSFGYGRDTVYLCPAPLYHAAPLNWTLGAHRHGGTAVVLEKFDAETALAQIEARRVTHAQFVPTMFVRMLKLPPRIRDRYDHSSLRMVLHSAAPCPLDVKRAMIDWWGPILVEYYGSTEGIGMTRIDSPEWLTHPGSVGRPLPPATLHVLGPDGRELPPGQVGEVHFGGGPRFEYHNAPDKTRASYTPDGLATCGDLGHLDEDGYLYLSERRTDLVLSGGVNLYPQEIEAALIMSPLVADVAVIGVPDDELGEAVKAVVEPAPGVPANDATTAEIMRFARANLSSFKCPKSIDFAPELPRLPSGKMLRRKIREEYGTRTRSHNDVAGT